MKEILIKYQEAGAGQHSISTMLYYCNIIQKYEAIRKIQGLTHIETCEMIGVDAAHMYRILKIHRKIKNI